MAMTSVQKGVLWGRRITRHHHRSFGSGRGCALATLFGFFWSYIGWIVSERNNDTRRRITSQTSQIPGVALADKYHFRSADDSGSVALPYLVGLPLFSILPEPGAAMARHVYDQFFLARLWHGSL